MTTQNKLEKLEDLFDVERGGLSPDMLLSEVEGYDSMSKLSLLVMMEDEFHKSLSAENIMQYRTVGDIMKDMQ